MNCKRRGGRLGMEPLSDKPDPGYGYKDHTWEECFARLRARLGAAEGVIDATREKMRVDGHPGEGNPCGICRALANYDAELRRQDR